MTRELVEMRGKRVKDAQFGANFLAILTEGKYVPFFAWHWRHNDRGGVSDHQPHDCLLSRLFRLRSKKTSKLRGTGLCAGNSPGPVNSRRKGPVTRKIFPFDDVIMVHDFFNSISTNVLVLKSAWLPKFIAVWHDTFLNIGGTFWNNERGIMFLFVCFFNSKSL